MLALLATVGFESPIAQAQASLPQNFVVEGRLYDDVNEPLNSSSVNIKLEILDGGSCVLFREVHSALDVTADSAKGIFAVTLGASPDQEIAAGVTLLDVFAKADVQGLESCVADGLERNLQISVDKDGSGTYATLTPNTRLASVPTAMVAAYADKLQGKTAAGFVQTNAEQLTQANVENIFSADNYTKLTTLLSGSSTQYLPSSPAAPVSFNGQRLTNLAAPAMGTDAANKSYVDSNLAGRAISAAAPANGQVLKWNGSTWAPAADDGITELTGEVIASGTGSVAATLALGVVTTAKLADGAVITAKLADSAVTNTKVADDSITSRKINSSGYAINRILITDGSTGTNVIYATCSNVNQIMAWTANGWACTTVASLAPVTSVAGKTGAVTLNSNDIDGLGTAAVKNVGVSAGDVIELQAGGRLPAVDGSALTNLNAIRLASRPVSSDAPASGEVLSWNGSTWDPASVNSLLTFPLAGSTGGASQPTYSFSGDTDTGWYSPAANSLAASTGSLERIRIDGSGNVGIGLSNPQSPLEVKGAIRMAGSTSGSVGFQPAAAAGNVVYTLPSSDGTGGFVLSTNGSGVMSWVSNTAGSVTSVGATAPLTSGGTSSAPTLSISQASSTTNGFLSSGDWTTFNSKSPAAGSTNITTLGTITTGTWQGSVIGVAYGGTGTNNGSITGTGALNFAAGGTDQNVVLAPSGAGSVMINKGLRLVGATSGYVGFQAPATAGSTTYTWPLGATNGFVLSTDASGNLSWVSNTAGSVTSVGATAPLSVGGTSSAPTLSVTQASSSASGFLSSTDWNTFNGKAPGVGSTSITTLGTIATGTWQGSVIGVAYGGTGTSNGSITGTGALAFTAGGANSNITLAPTGTGQILLNGPVTSAGNLMIGNQTSRTTASSRGQLALSSSFESTSSGSTTIDWNRGNVQELKTFVCNGTNTITMSNLDDGASYTLLLSGTAAHTNNCLFSGSGFTFKTAGGNYPPVASRDVLFNFTVIGTTVVYSMIDNLQ